MKDYRENEDDEKEINIIEQIKALVYSKES